MKSIATLILFALIGSMFYLFGAFVMWDMNAGNWPIELRFMVGLVGTFCAAFISTGVPT